MRRSKSLLVTFEGIEGSGKSYQSKKLYRKLKKLGYPVLYTREPGGCKSAETIRNIILTGKKNKFNILTDTLLYLASRNEHINAFLRPALKKNKIIICDRFIDSTEAYQSYGRGINKSLINFLHKFIIRDIKPNITFLLKLNVTKAFKRMNKRKIKNRYDQFSKKFYQKVQNGFINISKRKKRKFVVLDTSIDTNETENIIFRNIMKLVK
jgi:dTMP kinase